MPARLMGDKDGLSRTVFGICAAYVLTAILSISLSTPVSALETVPGSPCASICSRDGLDFANDTVCLDEDYESGRGQNFRDCTTCLLNSTAVDNAKNVSYVNWGLCELS